MRLRAAVALAVLGLATDASAAFAQAPPPQCALFPQLRTDAQQKALAVRTAMEHKVERKEICALVQRFYAAEANVVKFLEENKTWCGIPAEAITGAKAGHEHT